MNCKNFSGYVLAGGKSSRMKVNKALLAIDGANFVNRALDALKPVCEDRIKFVFNSRQSNFEEFPSEISAVYDIYENRGALGGIHAALKNCASEWAIILAVDLPLVNDQVIKCLAAIAKNSPHQIQAVIPRQPDGKLQPLCGIYRAKFCGEKLEILFQNCDSLSSRAYLENFPVIYVDSAKLSEKSARWFVNVNTPADYQSLVDR